MGQSPSATFTIKGLMNKEALNTLLIHLSFCEDVYTDFLFRRCDLERSTKIKCLKVPYAMMGGKYSREFNTYLKTPIKRLSRSTEYTDFVTPYIE